MVTEREYEYAKAICDILDNHKDWGELLDIVQLATLLSNDHEIAAPLWFSALHSIKEYEDGAN